MVPNPKRYKRRLYLISWSVHCEYITKTAGVSDMEAGIRKVT
jgi:hypothetical protein